MAWSRQGLLTAGVDITAVLAGCGGGPSAPATPPPATFEVRTVDDETVEQRSTGIGSQDPAQFRVVLDGRLRPTGRTPRRCDR